MAPKRRGRVASPEEDDGGDVAPTQQVDEDAPMQEDGGEEPQSEPEGDEDAPGSEDEEEPSRKRTRLSEDGVAGEAEPKNEPLPDIKPRITLPRDPSDGFIPGAIMGLKLHNFLTYDDVDFRCGPHLNMLIGANGTGKSSIAGAIAIGLGGAPGILGRQSDIQGFVKNGKKDGYVEVELKGPAGQPNVVIRRHITTVNKGSRYILNGQSVGPREIKNKLEELNVQVGNLCAFLPQDKVSEFANMSPQTLLRETQRAAGDPNLTAWHDSLIENSKELRVARELLETEKRELQHLESQNAALESTIAKYERRRKLEKQVELLNLLLPFAQYAESKVRYDEQKKRREALRQIMEEASAKIEPIERKKEEFASHIRTADTARRKAAEKPNGVIERIKRTQEEQEATEKESEAVNIKRNELKTQAQSRKKRLFKLKSEVTRLEKVVEKEPDVADTAEMIERRSELQRQYRAIMEDYRILQDKQKAIAEEISQRKEQVAGAQRGLQSLNDIASQRLNSLRKVDADVADVVEWLGKNQTMFKEEIFMPPWISVFVKDPKYQGMVESLFNLGNLKTFVVQNDEDYRKMNKLVNDDGIIGRKVRMNIWYRPPSQPPQRIPPEDLAKFGFDCYAYDCVQAPEGMRNYLEKELGLDRIPLALRENVDTAAMTAEITRMGGGTFITGSVYHQVTRSAYGRRLAQSSTRTIQKPRIFSGSQVDTERQKRLEQDIVNARSAINAEEAKMGELNEREAPMRNQASEIQDKVNEIKEQLTKIQNAKKQHETNKIKLETAQRNLAKEENAPDLKEEEENLKKKLLKHAMKRAGLMQTLLDLFEKLKMTRQGASNAAVLHQQAVANASAVEKLLSTYEQEVQRVKKDYERADEEFQRAKAASKKLLEATKAKIEQVSDELRQEFQTNYQDQGNAPSVAQVEEDLATKQAELELNHPMNHDVIRQYETRAAQIVTLKEKVETQEKKTNKLNTRVERTKNKWKPALEELVGQISRKFSAAFDRIRRAGEIHVRDAGDDYANWAIDIMVKFRETERLQVLDAHRQSGGERSLSTIMYLLSLTEHARIPFSLVDEINQGMDASAERDVHNQLVEVTCNTDCGQYFLITPKLLTGLHYHEKMKVLCVNNGDWVLHPETPIPNAGNLMKLVENYVNREVAAAA